MAEIMPAELAEKFGDVKLVGQGVLVQHESGK